MHHSTTTTTTTPLLTTLAVLDTPQQKLQSLVLASKVIREPSYSAKQYIRSAQSILNVADLARTRGELEDAFVKYLRATSIVLEVVTQDKDFEKLKTDPEYLAIKGRVKELFSDTEKIKVLLLEKYQMLQEVETLALETAAKASRPKPPPLPNKPTFLSSAYRNGKVVDTPSTTNSSFPELQSGLLSTVPQPTLYSTPMSMPTEATYGSMTTALTSLSFNDMANQTPAPTSLASYKPLMPTPMPLSSSSSTPVYQPSISSANVPMSGPVALPAAGYPPAPALAPVSNGSNVASASPVPGPRPAYAPASPASAPAVAVNSNGSDVKANSEPSSNANNLSASRLGMKDGKYTYPLSITPERLLRYMRQASPPSLLLIDVRMRTQFGHARINTAAVINIEPPGLRDGVSAKAIADQGMFESTPTEQKYFADRATFDLVIYYDQKSTEQPMSGPLVNLFRALHDLEFEKPLKRRPVFLIGGFDAWLDYAGMNWVQGHGVDGVRKGQPNSTFSDTSSVSSAASVSSTSSHSQSRAILTKLSQGGGINRHDGRVIMQSLGEYVNHSDGPQSMMHPKSLQPSNSPSIPNMAYPPTATPYSNLTATAYAPPPSTQDSIHGYPSGSYAHQQDNSVQGGPEVAPVVKRRAPNPNMASGSLQRRQTVYDDHWNAFGSPAGSQADVMPPPPIPAKIPLQNPLMPTTTTDIVLSSGLVLPPMGSSPTIRPPLPPKPMKPLPPAPGMNDLREYTKFGSGFSKMGESQLGKTGLTNLGNTCFMNSVIQCLIATPPLSRYFLDGSFRRNINMVNPLGTQGKLADAFSDLIRSMWSGQSLVVSPTSFRNAIIGFAPQFKGSEQHDSQEFLSFLLDGLHEDLKTMSQPPPPGDDEGSEEDDARMERLPELEASEIAWQRYLRRDNSIIVSLFQGQFKNRLSCTKCGKTSTTYNAFMYLALPIKAKTAGRPPQTLTSCLNAFVDPEVMEGEDAWNCPHCKKPRKAIKQLTISRVPNVLLIQLKRFSSDGPFKNKIKAMVQYPVQDLDLTKYLPKRSATEQPHPVLYDLYAVSNHSGEVSSGHYTACVRGETPGSWINFDDSRVSPCDKSVAVSQHGYTLFYVRKK
ncbi:ubiquitin-specific protease doa4 [Mortierella sp. NVP85]|nr:ubiquitin-specific protease doa4 [Mortierella sp. NVP85]